MGTMIFKLPAHLPRDAKAALQRAGVAGGQDNMPYPTQVLVEDGQMIVSRHMDESGCLMVPWSVDGAGRFMISTATLMERLNPYLLAVEMARGKINQIRGQAAEWLMGGLVMSEELNRNILQCTRVFSKAVTLAPDPHAGDEALHALMHGCTTADQLVEAYMKQVFEVRHQRHAKLDTTFGCRLGAGAPTSQQTASFVKGFNAVCVPLSWADIEPEEEDYHWQNYDEAVDWAGRLGLPIMGGPLVDFTGFGIPAWLWDKDTDISGKCAYLSDFVERVVERYRSKIRVWQLTAASNWAGVLARSDDELLWLTVKLGELVRRMDATLEIVIGLTQPWGDYLSRQEPGQSPFIFADNLQRTGMKFTALDLEIFMGIDPRGSYCRDMLDVSQLLDLYALLGVPLQVTLAYPSDTAPDPRADLDQKVGAGHWRSGYSPPAQADWAHHFARLCLCKPFVRSVSWAHFADAEPHQFPHCGLLDIGGQPKPALDKIASLRAEHLK